MFVDVGRIDGRDDIFWAEGSSKEEPSAVEAIKAINEFADGKYEVVKFNGIKKDQMQGFWRFSAFVKNVNK